MSIGWRTVGKSGIEEFEEHRPHSLSVTNMEVNLLLRYHPSTHEQIVHLPTVHIIGASDSFVDHGKNLFAMCNPSYATLIIHDGGHQLPRNQTYVEKIPSSITKAVEQM